MTFKQKIKTHYQNLLSEKIKSLKQIIVNVLICFGLVILGYLIVIFIAVLIGIGIAFLKGGPETLQYMKPK